MQGFTARIAMVKVFALASLALTNQTASADLGETETELVKRYGKPVEVVERSPAIAPAEQLLRFKANNCTVAVLMLKGRSAAEHHKFKDAISGPDDNNARSVLNAHTGDGKIMQFPDPAVIRDDCKYIWVIIRGKGGDSSAVVQKDYPNTLVIQTKEYSELSR
jgi:hypothetical protein